MRTSLHPALLLPALLLLVAGTTGCPSTSSVAISDPRDTCLENPSAYNALQPEEITVDSAGNPTDANGRPAALTVRVERRNCVFQVRVQSARGTGTFGPYERVDVGSISTSLGGGHYAFLAYRSEKEVRAVIDGVESEGHRSISGIQFSENRAHAAYLASDDDSSSLWLDGKQIARGPGAGTPQDVLGVLNDGRVAFTEQAADGRKRLVLGGWKSAAYDSISSSAVWRGERYTAFLQHGTSWEAVLDSRQEKMLGSPACQVTFSADGAHAMYLQYRGDTADRRYEAVVDGVAIPLPAPPQGSTPSVGFVGSLPYMNVYPQPARDPSTGAATGQPDNHETGILVLGVKTPATTPTRDLFTAEHAGRDGMYVQIGASKGPQLAQVDLESLRVDEQGRVHYRGRQASSQIEAVDNVVQSLPLVGGAPSLKVPDAPTQAAAPVQVAAPEVAAAPR